VNPHDQLSLFGSIRDANHMLDAAQSTYAEAYNFRLLGTRGLAKTWKERAVDNIEAIHLAQAIERDGRSATEAEQRQLIKFTGFGASDLANQLFPGPGRQTATEWKGVANKLHQSITDGERAALARATQYAHYTPEYMVRAIWKVAKRMGFTGGQVLEGGMGTGLFLALMPEGMASKSSYFGVENCPTTARIARLLYPEETILESDFTQAQLPPDFDLAIGNPPFSNRVVQGAKGRPELSLHDFFIARSIERLRAGGLAAFVVSRYTMDKQDKSARQYISSMADLLGAIRMPQGSMRADAGTDVVVDLLFFRKRHEGQPCAGVEWLNASFEAVTGDVKGGKINEYFAAHPDMALGKHAIVTSQFGPIYSLKASAERPLDIGLAEAIASLPENVYQAPALTHADIEVDDTPRVIVGTAKQGATIKEGSYFVENHKLYQVIDGGSVPVEVKSGRGTSGIFEKHAQIIRDLCAVRDAVRAVLSAQMSDVPSFIEQAQLARAYDAFVTAHGPINTTTITERAKNEEDKAAFAILKEWRLRRTKVELAKIKNKEPHPSHLSAIFDLESQFERECSNYGPIAQAKIETVDTNRYPNLAPFADDPDCWLVATIENYDPTTNTAVRGPIFSQQVVRPPIALEASTAADALAVVLNERGRVDMARIAELRNLTESEAVRELGDLVYFNPTPQEWETADQYLSGLVRDKLTFAQSAAESDPSFRRNVEALEKVQPRDLEPAEITARLGAPWIGANDIQRFVREVMRIDTSIYHTPRIATWSVQMRDFAGLASAMTDWGTPRMHAGELLLHALSSKTPQVFDEVEDGFGGVKRVLNPSETQAAKDKLAVIQQAFENWIWTDKERSDRLAAIYNKNFNNLVTRKFNGDHLVLPGASPVIQLRPHQKRVVWRMICNGSTYLAHAVGAGKTMCGAAGIMEQKRLGLLRKPMICVPNHMLAQWSREFLQLYPQANILVADEENFEKSKRSRFIARATTGDWDAIIITHSAFKFIPTPHEFEEEMIQGLLDQVEEVAETISRDDRVSTRRITQMRKHIEAKKEALEARLKAHDGRTDNMVHIGEMGVDSIFIDEGQQFRKLTFMTNMSDLKGVDPNGSDRAWHLYMATKFLHKKVYVEQGKKSRAIFMASGTPITNTIGELFSLQRFMCEETLEDRNIQHFDAWAATFGTTRTELELLPSGNYKVETRFAEFVNIPELTAMFLDVADVVMPEDLAQYVKLPRVLSGKRIIRTSQGSAAFKAYQKVLATRIDVIKRAGKPGPGDDIILVVINDGRHVAIDTRLVNPLADLNKLRDRYSDHIDERDVDKLDTPELRSGFSNDPDNKVNDLINNVFQIWKDTADKVYTDPLTGETDKLAGATQMVFSDLATEDALEKRGFSAYVWIRRRLIELGVPADQIAFMQNYKKAAHKQRLFNDLNSGRKRILLGSSETMGTGVNAQKRLVALHHLDVPWLPALIEQREGRILRQGNQNEEIMIYAYALVGSMDATMWQTVERKMRFISAVLKGDPTIRRLEDLEAESQADQFAMAKAMASGDDRLMKKAGLESEISKLERQRSAHYSSQSNVKRQIREAHEDTERCKAQIGQVQRDLSCRVLPSSDYWEMTVEGVVFNERKPALEALAKAINTTNDLTRRVDTWVMFSYAGFDVVAEGFENKKLNGPPEYRLFLDVRLSGPRFVRVYEMDIQKAEALLTRVEKVILGLEGRLNDLHQRIAENRRTIADFSSRQGQPWDLQAVLDDKKAELAALNADLAATNDNEETSAIAPTMEAA
jgi:N12 class adenine-specific DNA methylase